MSQGRGGWSGFTAHLISLAVVRLQTMHFACELCAGLKSGFVQRKGGGDHRPRMRNGYVTRCLSIDSMYASWIFVEWLSNITYL